MVVVPVRPPSPASSTGTGSLSTDSDATDSDASTGSWQLVPQEQELHQPAQEQHQPAQDWFVPASPARCISKRLWLRREWIVWIRSRPAKGFGRYTKTEWQDWVELEDAARREAREEARGSFLEDSVQKLMEGPPRRRMPGYDSQASCPRHYAAGKEAGPHVLGDKDMQCGCCAGTCEQCRPELDPRRPRSIPIAGEYSPAQHTH